MRLRSYRSLTGPAGGESRQRRPRSTPEALLAGLRPPPPGQDPAFDGAVLTLDQLLGTAEAMGWASSSSSPSSSSPLAVGGPLHGVRLICQLEAGAGDEVADQLGRLGAFLGAAAGAMGGAGGQGRGRPILDLVVVRSPPAAHPSGTLVEYLAAEALPAAAAFLEAVPPGSVGRGGRNAHGGPVGRHVMGVAHHLPGLGLGGLAEVADVLPPTRLLLDPAGLRGGEEEEEEEEEEEGGGKAAPPSQSDALGLSRELEAVVLGTDAIRAAPSAFDPPGRSAAEGDLGHGLFGAGTLFGEVWCAQQLEGAAETYVICDEDEDEDGDEDEDEDGGEGPSALAARVRAAFDGSAAWRAGAGGRREAEAREAASLLAARRGAGWGRHHSEEVAEAARALGLAAHLARDRDGGGGGLTAGAVKERWRSLAFRSHPDTAGGEGAGAEGAPTFAALRQHYLTLMDAVGQDEEGGDGRAPRM